jgi:hypothetical protein
MFNFSYAITGNYHDGMSKSVSNYGAAGTIETQNPYIPSGTTNFSTAWVMCNYGTSYWAQVGWFKYNGWTDPKYYFEYKGVSSGNYRYYFSNAVNGSNNDFKVGSDSTTMYFILNGTTLGTISLSSLGWSPDQVQLSAETTDSTVQSPGSVSNPVSFGSFQYKSTSNVWTSCTGLPLYSSYGNGYGSLSTQRNNISSSGSSNFEAWDSRY